MKDTKQNLNWNQTLLNEVEVWSSMKIMRKKSTSLLFRPFSAHELPQFLGRASSALRSEFIPFQCIRKGKQQRRSEILDSSFVFFVFGEPHSSVLAKHEENEAGVRNFGPANPTSPSRTSPLCSFLFGKHGGTRLVEHKGTKRVQQGK
jgi:hypothetical protein